MAIRGVRSLSISKILTIAAVISIMYRIIIMPFRDDDRRCAKDRFCFKNLKKTSILHRSLYELHISSVEDLKSLVISKISSSLLRFSLS